MLVSGAAAATTAAAAAGPDDHLISITGGLPREPGPRPPKGGAGTERHRGTVAFGLQPHRRSFHHGSTATQREGEPAKIRSST